MSRFHLSTQGALETNNPHELEGEDASTYMVAGRINSLRDAIPATIGSARVRYYSNLPCWHGHVAFDSVTNPEGRHWLLEGHYVDEGTRFTFDLWLTPDGTIRGASSKFIAHPVTSQEVMEAQEDWQHHKGLSGRMDPEDKLIHSCWRDRITQTSVQGSFVGGALTADVYGEYRLV